jgi:hypothetical protein
MAETVRCEGRKGGVCINLSDIRIQKALRKLTVFQSAKGADGLARLWYLAIPLIPTKLKNLTSVAVNSPRRG